MGAACSSERSASLVQLNKDNIPNFKIVLIGDPGVGKTNVLLRYTKNQFDYSYNTTRKPSIVNVVKKLNVPTNVVVSVTLWDLPGREDMDLRSTYYKDVDAVVVVVDMSDEASIDLAATWRQDFLNKASRSREVQETLPSGIVTTRLEPVKGFHPRSVPMLLLGNKYDLVEERLKQEEMKKMLQKSEENPLEELKEQLISEDDTRKDGDADDTKKFNEDKVALEKNTKNNKTSELAKDIKDELAALIDRDEGGSESDDDDEEDRERLFTPQRGQHAKKDTPHCVHLLEEMEKEKGYVGSYQRKRLHDALRRLEEAAELFSSSIIVSAKDKDGSVEAAIQSLVRHLLDKSNIIPKQSKKPVEKKKKKKKSKKLKESGFQPLTSSGVPEIDSLFTRSNVVLRRVYEYTTFYQVALHKFKQGCADLGILAESRVSLEDCICAVRDTVKQRMARELTLVEEDGFIRLHYEVDEDEDSILLKQMRNFVKLLDDFHQEYCAISRAVLRESPSLVVLLEKLDSRISERAEAKWAAAEAGTEPRPLVERVCDICEKNRARIAHARLQVQENVSTVEAAREKAKAAMIW